MNSTSKAKQPVALANLRFASQTNQDLRDAARSKRDERNARIAKLAKKISFKAV